MEKWPLNISEYSDTASQGALQVSGLYEVLALRQLLRHYNLASRNKDLAIDTIEL